MKFFQIKDFYEGNHKDYKSHWITLGYNFLYQSKAFDGLVLVIQSPFKRKQKYHSSYNFKEYKGIGRTVYGFQLRVPKRLELCNRNWIFTKLKCFVPDIDEGQNKSYESLTKEN